MDVLVTDGYFRKSLAAVRGLAAAGRRVLAAERVRVAPALMSRHASGRLVHPDPLITPRKFVRAISRAVRSHNVKVILPMEETTLLVLLDHQEELPPECRLYGAPAEVIRRLADKSQACRILAEAGFPVPDTSTDPHGIPLPAVVKPCAESGACGVVHVSDRETCVAVFERTRSMFGTAIVQSFVPGHGVGLSLLVDRDGETTAAFAHRRLRELKASGGASTLRESIPLPENVRTIGHTLREAGFWGPVNVEFRHDERDGSLRPIEINPRYWGSLALPLRAGINFPELHYRLAMGEKPPAATRYPVGIRCRWLLPGDLLAGFDLFRRRMFRAAMATLDPRGPFDILSLDDPGPALARLAAPAALLASAGLRSLLSRSSPDAS